MDRINARLPEKASTGDILDAFVGVATDALAAGDDILLRGFGSFKVVTRAARVGRNPQTGESIAVPEHSAVKFKAGRQLSAAVGAAEG